MNRRHSQLFALAILIGTPLLVSMATNAGSAPQDGSAAAAPAPDAQPPAEVQSQAMPQPLPTPSPNQPGQAVVLGSTAPTLDPAGQAIAVADPVGINVGGSEPAAPVASTPAMNLPSADVAAAPPAAAQRIAQQQPSTAPTGT